MEKEVLLYKNRFNHFSTLYLGGGTPTVLSERDIERLTECIYKHFTFSPDAETTIEANPNDLTPEKLKLLCSLGFNRISLGVQSFDEEVLALLKRRHTAAEAKRAIELIRKAGFTNLSIDLMYAIPGQTRQSWEHTLSQAISYKPEHISCYQLTIKEGTPFWLLKEEGNIKPLDEKEEESFFLTTSELLQGSGYVHYEISNFARDEKHYSAHNRKYWQHVPYLGLGPSAHSFFENTRWWNCRSVKQYNQLLDKGSAPIEDMEKVTDEQLRLEALFLSFRTRRGMNLDALQTYKRVESILQGLIESELVEITGRRVVPTTKGFLVADSIPLLFV
jgi:oxygen-independent coproporphyrinogen-3 oxidase